MQYSIWRNTWLLCHVRAYEFFGGVAVHLICDNLKTGVAKHPKEGEVVLTEVYECVWRSSPHVPATSARGPPGDACGAETRRAPASRAARPGRSRGGL